MKSMHKYKIFLAVLYFLYFQFINYMFVLKSDYLFICLLIKNKFRRNNDSKHKYFEQLINEGITVSFSDTVFFL